MNLEGEGGSDACATRKDPFPTLVPFQVLQYPVPPLMPAIAWPDPAAWPPPMNPRVARWKEQTDHLPRGGNQIYVHVPFCPFHCHFCPLYKTKDPAHRNAGVKEQFVQAIVREIEIYGAMPFVRERRDVCNTIYFGGGTPTELTPAQLGRILAALRAAFAVSDDCEITLEGVATQMLAPGYLDAAFAEGFNRISFGVQSLDPDVRRRIGRGEDARDYHALIELCHERFPGVPLNLDLMAGLPGQSVESFARDIEQTIAWNIDSIDVYAFWMVPGTRLYEFVRDGRRDAPAYGGGLLDMRRKAHELFDTHGYRAVSGEAHTRSDRNVFIHTTFGGGGNTLVESPSFGPSAIGFLNGTMYRNACDLTAYLEAIAAGRLPISNAQTLDLATARRRAFLMGFQRLVIPTALVETRRERKLFARFVEQGLVVEDGEVYRLTAEGSIWYNHMQMELLPGDEARRMAGIMGSAREQLAMLSGDAAAAGLGKELTALVRGSDGFVGSLRMAAYKSYLQLKRLPLFDDRGMSWTGPIDRDERKARAVARPAAAREQEK